MYILVDVSLYISVMCFWWMTGLHAIKVLDNYTSLYLHQDKLQEEHILFPQFVKHKLIDDVLLFSLCLRPTYDAYTRTQRLYTLAAVLAVTMLTSAMWYSTDKEDAKYGVPFGPIIINYKQIITGFVAACSSLPPILLIVFCFRNYRERNSNYSNQNSSVFLHDRKFLPWYFCVLTWIFVLCIIIACGFIIFMYSLQWGGTVANEWLLSLFFSTLFDCVIWTTKSKSINL